MTEPDEPEVIRNIISAQGCQDATFFILLVYDEVDALNAVGQVLKLDRTPDGQHRCVLNTNDPLQNMWMSPAGHLWIGTANGHVWTTAPMPAQPAPSLVTFETLDPSLDWKVMGLPRLKHNNCRPNATAIWGTSDSDIFIATFQGAIYHWDGSVWQQMETGVETGLNHIHGSGRDDLYCVGDNATILHYDGHAWARIPVPKKVPETEVLTGVRVCNPTEVYVCGRGGFVLKRGGKAFRLITTAEVNFYGIANFNGKLMLAGGSGGVWVLHGARVDLYKDKVHAVSMFEADPFLYVVEPEQKPTPSIVEYDPSNPDPWGELTF